MEISLILPTRERTARLRQALESLAATAARPDAIEVLLYVDLDDDESRAFTFPSLSLHTITGPRVGMAQMTRACYARAAGRNILLANDDIFFRTPGWDAQMLAAADRWPDGLCLVWANDLCSGLPAHPLLPRATCDRLGEVCPADYARLHIDTHLYDVFRRLKRLGHDRLCYLPRTIIEHLHVEVGKAPADATAANPHREIDEQQYLAWADERERLALRLARELACAERDREVEGISDQRCQGHASFEAAPPCPPVVRGGGTRAISKARPIGAEGSWRRMDWGTQLRVTPQMARLLARQVALKRRAFAPVHARAGEGVPPSEPAFHPLRKVRSLLRFLRRTALENRETVRQCWTRLCALRAAGVREAAVYGDGEVAQILVALSPSAGVEIRGVCPFEPGMPLPADRVAPWDVRQLAAWPGHVVVAALVNSKARAKALARLGLPDDRMTTLT